MDRFCNAEGVSKLQPRVARASALPWVTTETDHRNSERVAEGSLPQTPVEFAKSDQSEFTVDLIHSYPDSERDRKFIERLKLHVLATLSGFRPKVRSIPRVARWRAQPWAGIN